MNNTIFASRTVTCFEIPVRLTHLVIQTHTSAYCEVVTVAHYRRTNALAAPSSNMHLGLKPLSLFSVQKNDCQLPVFLFTTHTRPVDFRALKRASYIKRRQNEAWLCNGGCHLSLVLLS